MKVHEAMVTNSECVGPNDRVMAARDLLSKGKIDSVPVLDHHKVSGSLSNKDIVETAARMGTDALHLSVRESMNTDPFTVCETDDVEDAEKLMDEHKRLSVTVLNGKNEIVGVLKRR